MKNEINRRKKTKQIKKERNKKLWMKKKNKERLKFKVKETNHTTGIKERKKQTE